MNVLLAIPTAGNPTAPFLASLHDIQLPKTTAFDRITIVGNFIPGQRDLAARRAMLRDADVLVMLDDDMIVPPHAVAALCQALEADPQLAVAGALYYSRDGVHPMAAAHWASHDTTKASIPAFGEALTYCDVVGFGCVAVRVKALRGIPPPFFSTQVYVEEHAARVHICNEDYLFCERIRHAGWLVALHAGVRCKHYNRVTGISHPAEWEDSAATAFERMMVVDPGPRYRLIPYDPTAPTKHERHAAGTVDYIIVD